jgi:hypothetical protein
MQQRTTEVNASEETLITIDYSPFVRLLCFACRKNVNVVPC